MCGTGGLSTGRAALEGSRPGADLPTGSITVSGSRKHHGSGAPEVFPSSLELAEAPGRATAMVCAGPSGLARNRRWHGDSGRSDQILQCASAEGCVGEGPDAVSTLIVRGPRPQPAVATYGRQTADSAVASTPTPAATPEVELFTGRQAPEEARHAMTGLLGGVIPRGFPPRGFCVVRGVAPHLWALAAEAIVLRVL